MKERNPGHRMALSPEATRFLLQLSIALHKTIAYPERQAVLQSAVDGLVPLLKSLCSSGPPPMFEVTRDRLRVGEGTTDPSNAILRGLAGVLHRHRIAALRVGEGAAVPELMSLLDVLAEGTRIGTPLGGGDPAALEQWPHIELVPSGVEERPDERDEDFAHARELWNGLVAEALQAEERSDDGAGPDPATVAHAIRDRLEDADYDRRLADRMLELGRELADRDGAGSSVAVALGDLVLAIGDTGLRTLLEQGTDPEGRQALTGTLVLVLPARAAIDLATAAADASRALPSQPLLGIFRKMAAMVETGPDAVSTAAGSALRDAIARTVEGPIPDDRAPEPNGSWLGRLTPGEASGRELDETVPGDDALRILDIAINAEADGPVVWRAVDELVELGRLEDLFEILAGPTLGPVARKIRSHLVRPGQIRALLRTPQDRRVIEHLLGWAGSDSVDALLDGLETADSRAVRRLIIARLLQIGESIVPRVLERLEARPWNVQRDMLHLLAGLPTLPGDFSPARWIESDDVRIRREAVLVGLAVPAARDRAIAVGIADADARNLGPVLGAAAEKCPRRLAPELIDLLARLGDDSPWRGPAILALGGTGAGSARKWLIEKVIEIPDRHGKPSLRPKSRDLLCALSALRSWRRRRDVARTLGLARRSDDAEIRSAATGSRERP